ncbi:MAG: hypothetical protein GY851_24050 [bacterium]|nr:hypothetical protein [bacterium]
MAIQWEGTIVDATKLGPQPEPPDLPIFQILIALVTYFLSLLGWTNFQ